MHDMCFFFRIAFVDFISAVIFFWGFFCRLTRTVGKKIPYEIGSIFFEQYFSSL